LSCAPAWWIEDGALEHSESQAIRYAITAETERRRKADSVSKTAVSIFAHKREKKRRASGENRKMKRRGRGKVSPRTKEKKEST